MLQVRKMQQIYKKEATLDTMSMSTAFFHNCPTCRCTRNNQTQNLYLANSKDTLPPSDHMTMTFAPIKSQLLANCHFHNTYPQSPKGKQITFSYVSPPKNKNYRSADAKFSTKKFKDSRFPLIKKMNEVFCEPIKTLVGNKNGQLDTMTDENTPEKHKILKLNKVKSQKNKQFNYQSKINSLKIISLQNNQSTNRYTQNIRHFQINKGFQEKSPFSSKEIRKINYNTDGNPKKQMQRQKVILLPNQNNPNSTALKNPEGKGLISPLQKNRITTMNKYPTVRSIEIYQMIANSQKIESKSSDEITSLNAIENRKHPQTPQIKEQRNFASSLTKELQLNYDYYYPTQDSDRSLSFNIDL